MGKANGKGLGISLHGGTSDINASKMRIEAQTNAELRVPEFKPLTSFPATAHPRQGEIDAFRDMPSRYAI